VRLAKRDPNRGRGSRVKLIGIAAVAAALALPSLALGEDTTYDETQNWLAAWARHRRT